jgi:hypothetical protein
MRSSIWLRIVIVVVSIAIDFTASRAAAQACVVREESGPRGAQAVFRGRVTRIEVLGGEQRLHFAVEERFWGSPGPEAIVAASMNPSVPFRAGQQYLVYAYAGQGGSFTLPDCSASLAIEKAGRQMQELRAYLAHAHSSALEWHY